MSTNEQLPALPEPYTPSPVPERVKFKIGSTKGLDGTRIEWHAVEIDDCEAHARAEVARRDAQWRAAVAQRDEQIAKLTAEVEALRAALGTLVRLSDETAMTCWGDSSDAEAKPAEPRESACGLTECRGQPMCRRCQISGYVNPRVLPPTSPTQQPTRC